MGYAELYGADKFHLALEKDVPWVNWRAPLIVSGEVNPAYSYLACRYCVAAYGLKGSTIEKTPFVLHTVAEFGAHMVEKHPLIDTAKRGSHVH